MSNEKGQVKMQLKCREEIAGGTYANNIIIHMTREEFVLDFVNVVPPSATVNARVVLSPSHVKRMIKALSGSLEKYETEFGKLPDVTPAAPPGEIVQ
jgi:uncharacterized protein DUF3467